MAEEIAVTGVKSLFDLAAGQLAQGMVAAQLRQNDMANQIQHSQGILNMVSTVVGVNKLINIDPAESAAILKTMSGNDLGQQILSQLAASTAGGKAVKSEANTPPETGQGD